MLAVREKWPVGVVPSLTYAEWSPRDMAVVCPAGDFQVVAESLDSGPGLALDIVWLAPCCPCSIK
jgi:hypothetical protein